ncbi:MAG: zinc-ribbon domain-containing protein [Candidatus Bathyarchaeota archaeon]|nr:zinc-ribbon domain-containing protein [Candidatus Bathyarchaeota archaeon]
MEYCPYCQRWVEPTKDHTDLIAGQMFGRLGKIVGGAHYLLKVSRCPICNNKIEKKGKPPITTHQLVTLPTYPQPQVTLRDTRQVSRYCGHCGSSISSNDNYCMKCGKRTL